MEKSILKLVGYPIAPTTLKVLTVADFCGVTLEREFNFREDTKNAEHVKNSPTGTLPLLYTPDGFVSESAAICEYLGAEKGFFGNNNLERALVRQWLSFASQELYMPQMFTIYPILGFIEADNEKQAYFTKTLKDNLEFLEHHLKERSFLVGDRVTMADIEVYTTLRRVFQLLLPTDLRNKVYPNLTKYFTSIASHEHVVRNFGPTLLCKAVQKAPKVEKPKEEPKKETHHKKEEPKKETHHDKETTADGEATNEEEAPKKKKTNPLDELPVSTFVLDEWKRVFMNSKDKPAEMENFWNLFDPNGYSIWHFHYQKLDSECKVYFKTKNSYAFWLQKLDSFRKYSFSAHGMYGEEGNYEIRGVWMWRGTDVPDEMKSNDLFEFITVRRLDHNSPDDRQLITEYWLNVEAGQIVEGLPVSDVVLFR